MIWRLALSHYLSYCLVGALASLNVVFSGLHVCVFCVSVWLFKHVFGYVSFKFLGVGLRQSVCIFVSVAVYLKLLLYIVLKHYYC